MTPPRIPRVRWMIEPFRDRVLRALAIATLIATLGRGAFITLTVLYFTTIVGLGAAQVAIILTLANSLGVVSSLIVGHLADRVSARRLQLGFVLLQAAALATYSQARTFGAVLTVACVVSLADRAANAARSAVIARGFSPESRVRSRSVLRTVTNVGIATGSALASIPLTIGTEAAYKYAFVIGACFTASSAIVIAGLPARVDAVKREKLEPTTGHPAGKPPLLDPRYLALSALAGVFAMHFTVFDVGMPQWITGHTQAPAPLVSVVLIVNAVLVIALQIPLSRGTEDIRRAGNVFGVAGVFMSAACVLYALSGSGSAATAAVLLIAGACAHTMAEILSSAGGWGLSFELADITRAGAYQGVFALGTALALMIAPSVITLTALQHGAAGWLMLAVVFMTAAGGVTVIARRASSRPLRGPGEQGAH
jgi:MFS family permease